MLEVTLIGAPGAGKTEAAEKVAKEFQIGLLPNPANKLKGMNVAVGLTADYITNMEIAMLRRYWQREWRLDERDHVSDGSVIEGLAHAGIAVEMHSTEVPTERLRGAMLRDMQVATVLATVLLDTLNPMHLYYLPIWQTKEKDEFPLRVDDAIRAVIEKFDVPVKEINGPDRAQTIIDHIKENP